MGTILKISMFSLLAVLLFAGSARATNITIWDEANSGREGWHNRGTNPGEDQEVEPGCLVGQQWDLEGFFLNDKTLTMVGGFDFIYGQGGITSGDIFIDIDGDAQYGTEGLRRELNTDRLNYGYDYVLDLNFENPDKLSYSVYELSKNSELLDVYFYNDPKSTPWRYNAEKSEDDYCLGTFDLITYYGFGYDFGALIDEYPGFKGRRHNAVSVDLAFLEKDIDNFTSHFTMECGNDNLMGRVNPVPEPATMMLFGCGLVGIAAVGRKKLFTTPK